MSYSSDAPRASGAGRRRVFSRGVAEYGFTLLLVLGTAAVATLLSERHQSDDLRLLLDRQQTAQQRLLARLQQFEAGQRRAAAPEPAPAPSPSPLEQRLQTQLGTLLEDQEKLRDDVQALSAALADTTAERDRLRERLAARPTDRNDRAGADADVTAVSAAPPAVVKIGKHVPVLRDIPGKGLRLQEIHFSPTSSTLSPGAVLKTREAAALFKQQDKTRIRLVGFSDTVGSAAGNQRISQRRAAAVAELLVGAGIPRSKIELVAKGEQGTPLLTGDDVDEPLNRCVGIFAVD